MRDIVEYSGPDRVDTTVIEQADKNVHAHSDVFLKVCTHSIEQFLQKLDKLTKQVEDPSCEELSQLLEPIYDMRVLGTSFNYPLISLVGNHCEKFIQNCEKQGTVNTSQVKTLHAFISALDFITTNKVTGSGGPQGKGLLKNLTDVIQGKAESFVPPTPKQDPNIVSQEKLNGLLNNKHH
ncbi:hypothetical protein MTBPR1_100073 [Candidatus Terasakiella magnetica]|uniref:HPt domain-containing protein n=1 Tax=Candidatus Terasakiella magnetica TaxID=1867952 RepID=A0A1C3RDX2_9PROT|nr:hypothetical protein [Candidatus Terasakiella magnetica]SCA55432.1 hypothetical protein MTBPR1_100073 [Candidatus Terasakiella magnetica]